MAITFDNSGKPTYMFQAGATSTDGVWYAVGAKIDTASGYEWGGAQTFLNTVTTDATAISKNGWNNFLNPAARDAAIPSPVHGIIAFVRQNAGGTPINQIQFYNGTTWVANDGDISGVTAGTGLSGGGTSGTITLNVDTTVVATTSNTLTMSSKTLTAPAFTGTTKIEQILEKATLSTSAPTVTTNYDVVTNGAVTYVTASNTSNYTLNVRGDGSTTLNSIMTTGQSLTIAHLVTNGGTAYYLTSLQIDGTTSGVITEWQNGTAPSSGNINSVDIYSITIIKTGNAAFTAFAAQTRFA